MSLTDPTPLDSRGALINDLVFVGQSFRLKPSARVRELVDLGILERVIVDERRLYRAAAPGFFSLEGETRLVLPRAFRREIETSSSSLARLVFLTVACIEKFWREKTRRSVGQTDEDLPFLSCGDPSRLSDSLKAALLLWQDYREFGEFVQSRRLVSAELPGRILWDKTLRHGQPTFSRFGTVFQSVYRRSVRRDPKDELTGLHRASCLTVGRWLGRSKAVVSAPSTSAARSILSAYKHRCFSDRQRRVHGLLERFYQLAGASAQARPISALFLKNFEILWERALQVALGHDSALRGPSLTGFYQIHESNARLRGLSLRPDILTVVKAGEHPHLLVLDAKDYQDGSWPKSKDIAKQMLYRFLLSCESGGGAWPLARIANAFLFPASLKSRAVALRGYHDTHQALEHGLGHIWGIDLDAARVLDTYLGDRRDSTLLDQVSAIALGSSQQTLA